MKIIIGVIMTMIILPAAVMAASYSIDENQDVDLSGINKIIFELKTPNCALCINTGSQNYEVSGGGRTGKMSLSLSGELRSNNKKAVPSLITDNNGRTLTIHLYKDNSLFFGLVQSGSILFQAVLPDYFDGDIEVLTSSGDSQVSDINSKTITVKSSSGYIDVSNIEAEDITIGASSGKTTAENLSATGSISLKSSSGNIEADNLLSEEAEIHASSGRIEIGRARTSESFIIHASSGRINADYLEGNDVALEASSGKISVNELNAGRAAVEASSGNINIPELRAGSARFEASSGKTTIGVAELIGDIDIRSSSGNVDIAIPVNSAFSADLQASSGKIRSGFKLLGEIDNSRNNEIVGDANGGGHSLTIKATSGNITITER